MKHPINVLYKITPLNKPGHFPYMSVMVQNDREDTYIDKSVYLYKCMGVFSWLYFDDMLFSAFGQHRAILASKLEILFYA